MANKVSTKELGLILGTRLMKTDDLHYGYWGPGLEVNLANLPKAQAAYSQFLMAHIPAGTKTILDVGCGTGHLSEQLRAHGFQVEGISPSPMLSDMVAKRLGPDYKLYRCMFEDFATPQHYDLILFSESFQYIKPALSLPKAHGLLNNGGHVLIADFFRTDAPGVSALKGGHELADFYRILKNQPFRVLSDEDITPQTAPNLKLVDDLLSDYALPVWEAAAYYLKNNRPWLSALVYRLFQKKIDQAHFKYFSHQRTAENFAKFKSYRTLVLQKA